MKINLALNEATSNAAMDAGTNPTPPPPASGPRSYQDLDGGFGKEVNFRPARYPSAELGPIGTIVSVETEQGIHLCRLHDVSQNGVAFEWNGGPLEVGDTIPLLTVS